MLDEKVKKLFQEQSVWDLATCGDEPNVVPIGLTAVLDDGKLVLGDVDMEESLANIKANGKAAVAAWTDDPVRGYQVKGSAEYITDGPIFQACKEVAVRAFGGEVKIKGAVVVTPEKCVALS